MRMSNRETILQAIKERRAERKAIKDVIAEIIRSGAASATLSNASGSKSYTRLSLPELRKDCRDLSLVIQALQRRLKSQPLIGSVSVTRR